MSLTLYRLEPRQSPARQALLCSVESFDADPAETGLSIDAWIDLRRAAGMEVGEAPDIAATAIRPATLTGRERIRIVRLGGASDGLRAGPYLLVEWAELRDIRVLVAGYFEDEAAWWSARASGAGLTAEIGAAFRRFASLVRGRAADDQLLLEVSRASHAKEIGRFVPGDAVGRELTEVARVYHESAADLRLLDVLVRAARRDELGPRSGACAFCPGLGACIA